MIGSVTVAEKIVVNDTYSLEEQTVGTWIDGTPIYRRVFTGTSSSGDRISVNVGGKIIPLKVGGYIENQYGHHVLIGGYFNSEYFGIASYNPDIGTLSILRTNSLNGAYVIIFEYARTND